VGRQPCNPWGSASQEVKFRMPRVSFDVEATTSSPRVSEERSVSGGAFGYGAQEEDGRNLGGPHLSFHRDPVLRRDGDSRPTRRASAGARTAGSEEGPAERSARGREETHPAGTRARAAVRLSRTLPPLLPASTRPPAVPARPCCWIALRAAFRASGAPSIAACGGVCSVRGRRSGVRSGKCSRCGRAREPSSLELERCRRGARGGHCIRAVEGRET
jgi:hypothetical protein